jgi:DNA-directed RNA polymerase sigma subunit (sigma70/sigma32)
MQDATLPSEGRTHYFAEIRRFPMLKAEEEHTLAVRWRARGDESAAHQLLTSHKLEELATKFRISRERVRQIEHRALQTVRKAAHGAMSQRRQALQTHH